ncbi:hypothetical protein [Myxococcus sp. AS-1-15]|uniref:hypothetical protein n=1 Tax=Myxococcus sp. AS-1-15 TaxID=2874600 RepID=UPI001CC012FA|nr:hypothetical protein [Myxococcus sp. AS-1-15]MBZ4402162.1 hypothetical protein [Myxococcus sp. AS-1-15]
MMLDDIELRYGHGEELAQEPPLAVTPECVAHIRFAVPVRTLSIPPLAVMPEGVEHMLVVDRLLVCWMSPALAEMPEGVEYMNSMVCSSAATSTVAARRDAGRR